jgi:hypothetical protein
MPGVSPYKKNQDFLISTLRGKVEPNFKHELTAVESLNWNTYPALYSNEEIVREGAVEGESVLSISVPKKYPVLYKLKEAMISLSEKNSDCIMNIASGLTNA